MSTPCLNGIVDASGSYLIDVNGNKYLDFHGNSSHQVGYKNPYVVEVIKRKVDELHLFQEGLHLRLSLRQLIN